MSTEFRGWPTEAFEFYAKLKANNSKAFWTANKPTYDAAVKGPYAALSAALAPTYGELHMFRPNRDIRFSKDKSPYKDHAGAVGESEGGASYYVQLSADGLFVGCGHYTLAADQLERWRAAVADDKTGKPIGAIVAKLRTGGYDIGAMESLKTAPRGFDKDHARVELLRLKGLTMGRAFPIAKWMHSAKALDRICEVFADAGPMNAWLDKHVGASTLPPPEFGR